MASIKICDWLKKQLGKSEETYTLILDGKEYEISKQALEELRAILDSDVSPWNDAPLTNIVRTAPLRLRAQVATTEPATIAEPNQAAPEAPAETQRTLGAVPPITIPGSLRERLAVPTQSQADSVIADSTRFREGTLGTLTPGKARKVAQEILKTKWEAQFEDNKPERQLPDRVRRGE